MIFYVVLSLWCAKAQRLVGERILNRVAAEWSQVQMVVCHVVAAFLWSDCELHLLILRALRWIVALTLFCVSLLLVFRNWIIQLVWLALIRIIQFLWDAKLHFHTAFLLWLVSLASLFGFRSLKQQIINQNLIFQVTNFFLWVSDSGTFVREFAGYIWGSRCFRLGCMWGLADALFTGFACGG